MKGGVKIFKFSISGWRLVIIEKMTFDHISEENEGIAMQISRKEYSRQKEQQI